MPLFSPEFTEDEDIIRSLAVGVCEHWNNNRGSDLYGFEIFTSEVAIKNVSREADRVLSHFPDPPGPFKRLATLLILARLCPLFFLGKSGQRDVNTGIPIPWKQEEEQVWLPRICYLMIEPVLDILRVVDPKTKRELPLDDWYGFPSAHSKAEFILLLEWLRDYDAEQLDDAENLARRGRMVLAVSLILEAVYYQTENLPGIVGICDSGIADFTCVTFDAFIDQ